MMPRLLEKGALETATSQGGGALLWPDKAWGIIVLMPPLERQFDGMEHRPLLPRMNLVDGTWCWCRWRVPFLLMVNYSESGSRSALDPQG